MSILHLCAVSIDRYYAIVKEPLLYQVGELFIILQIIRNLLQNQATRWRTAVMIFLAWAVGLFIGFVSVFSGIYTTDMAATMIENTVFCEFEVIDIFFS